MTTTTLPAPSTIATPPPRPLPARRALARVEGGRLVRHPLFLMGMAFSALLMATGGSDGERLELLCGWAFTFFGAAIWLFVAACLGASRERRDGAEDLYGAQPVGARVRTQASLLALAWAGAAGAALVAGGAFVLTGFDGVLLLDGQRHGLRPLELAQGPLYLVAVGAFGVFVGTWTRHAYPAVVGALVLFAPPLAWLPWIVLGDVPESAVFSDWLVGAAVAWHDAGLAGLALLAAAGALARHDRRPRIALLAVAGLGSAIVGLALGWPTG